MQSYNPLDYTYRYNVPVLRLTNMLRHREFEVSVGGLGEFVSILTSNNRKKERIEDYIDSHEEYLEGNNSLEDRNLVHLWTIPEICGAAQRILRGIVHPNSMDLEYLQAILEFNNEDISWRADDLRKRIRDMRTQAEKEQEVNAMIRFVLDRFIVALTDVVWDSPSGLFDFFAFRGINGNIVQRYSNLAVNDIVVERGFSSVTWQPLKAIEYAKGDGTNPPAYVSA